MIRYILDSRDRLEVCSSHSCGFHIRVMDVINSIRNPGVNPINEIVLFISVI